jgi:23S rRNA (cytosine1962-C5)-methyltransferase
MTSNCSSALNTQEFVNLVQQQALLEHKSIQILGIYGPSICHPVLPVFPEGQYLTAILLVVM